MRAKLLKLMNAEGLTASKLAELLGIRSSGISHIISGRNNPSFDLLQKILKRFPNINPDWLLLDSDQMYRDATTTAHTWNADDNISENDENVTPATNNGEPMLEFDGTPQQRSNVQQAGFDPGMFAKNSARGVKRVIVLFDDHTFESYEVR